MAAFGHINVGRILLYRYLWIAVTFKLCSDISGDGLRTCKASRLAPVVCTGSLYKQLWSLHPKPPPEEARGSRWASGGGAGSEPPLSAAGRS